MQFLRMQPNSVRLEQQKGYPEPRNKGPKVIKLLYFQEIFSIENHISFLNYLPTAFRLSMEQAFLRQFSYIKDFWHSQIDPAMMFLEEHTPGLEYS